MTAAHAENNDKKYLLLYVKVSNIITEVHTIDGDGHAGVQVAVIHIGNIYHIGCIIPCFQVDRYTYILKTILSSLSSSLLIDRYMLYKA